MSSAGGQLEQPSDVKSSTTTMFRGPVPAAAVSRERSPTAVVPPSKMPTAQTQRIFNDMIISSCEQRSMRHVMDLYHRNAVEYSFGTSAGPPISRAPGREELARLVRETYRRT